MLTLKNKYSPVATRLLLLLLKLTSFLPGQAVLKSAGMISLFLRSLSSRLVHVSKTNIELCFPGLTAIEREELLEQSINELGHSIAETLCVWFNDTNTYLRQRFKIENEWYWHELLAQEKGIILLSCHSGSLDLNVALINQLPRRGREFAITYRQPAETRLDVFLRKVRQAHADLLFPVSHLLGISRVLKKGGIVWYAPDIETSKKGRVFVKFMGVEAATPNAIAKLTEATGASILPFMHRRNDDGNYTIKFFPPLNLGKDLDAATNTQIVNDTIEAMIRENPAAYWWCIKRFRYREDGGPSVYLHQGSVKN